jgi:hypothetical protein
MCCVIRQPLLDAILQDQHLAGVRRAQLSADGERSGPRRQCSRLAHCSFPTVASAEAGAQLAIAELAEYLRFSADRFINGR